MGVPASRLRPPALPAACPTGPQPRRPETASVLRRASPEPVGAARAPAPGGVAPAPGPRPRRICASRPAPLPHRHPGVPRYRGDGAFTPVKGLAMASLPMQERTPRVSRRAPAPPVAGPQPSPRGPAALVRPAGPRPAPRRAPVGVAFVPPVCSVPPVATAARVVLAPVSAMAHCLHPAVDNAPFTTRQGARPRGARPGPQPGRRGTSPQPQPPAPSPSPCRRRPPLAPAAPHLPCLRLAPSVAAPTVTPASQCHGGDGAFTRVRGLAKAPLPMQERTPRVSRQSSCATGVSVIAESREPQSPELEQVPCKSARQAMRHCDSWEVQPHCLPGSSSGGRVRVGPARTAVTAFGRQRRQAEPGFCRELRQLRQHGAWPGRRCEPRRRAAARSRKAPLAAVVRLRGGTGADPAGPRPEAAAAQSVSLPSHQSHQSLQAIGPRELTLVTAGEPPVTSRVRFTCN